MSAADKKEQIIAELKPLNGKSELANKIGVSLRTLARRAIKLADSGLISWHKTAKLISFSDAQLIISSFFE